MEPQLGDVGASLVPAQRTEVFYLPSHKIWISVHSGNMHHPIKVTKHQQAQHLPGRRITRCKIRSQPGAAPCFSPTQGTESFPQPSNGSGANQGKVWVDSTRARKLLWQTKGEFGLRAAAADGSSLLTHTALLSNAGTAALGGKKSQQLLISYNLEMSINVSIKFQGV